MKLSFDDTLLTPQFSTLESRKDVSTSINWLGIPLTSPIISSNMDSVTNSQMAATMALNGAVGTLHRFNTIDENVQEYYTAKDIIFNNVNNAPHSSVIGSVGIGDVEYERAIRLAKAGCQHILIDVAHGAAIHVVKQYDRLRRSLDDSVYIIVGNFAKARSIEEFNKHSTCSRKPDSYKIGVGSGSNCSTRIVTGCGWPTLASLLDCKQLGLSLIADGGMKNSGDIVKALAAGADVVMLGSLLAGTDETPGEIISQQVDDAIIDGIPVPKFTLNKKYRGSASAESYAVQGKTATHRAPEGVSRLVPYKGPVVDVLNTLNGGIRSGMTYLNASSLTELRNCEIVQVSNSGHIEGTPHGLFS